MSNGFSRWRVASETCWNISDSFFMAWALVVKGSAHAGMFPFPLWIVPPLSQLEVGHLQLKRPEDTCFKCILPLADGNNWSLERALTYCHLTGSDIITSAEELLCVSHRPTDLGGITVLFVSTGLVLWNLRLRLSMASSEHFRRQWNLVPT